MSPVGDRHIVCVNRANAVLSARLAGKVMPLYAKAGVRELWIENLQEDLILVYRNPGPEAFATSLVFERGQSLSMTAFPQIVFAADELPG